MKRFIPETPVRTFRWPICRSAPRDRDEGIALIVVFILFVVLYLVVFQLEYSTKMEEELAEIRATEAQGAFAISSVAAEIMARLAEDANADQSKQGSSMAGGAGSALTAVGGAAGLPAGVTPEQLAQFNQLSPEQQQELLRQGQAAGVVPGAGGAAGAAVSVPGAATQSQGSGTIDYYLESVVDPGGHPVSYNGIEIEFRIIDNERCFDLNRLWEYARLPDDTLTEAQQAGDVEEARRAVEESTGTTLGSPLGAVPSDEEAELNSASVEWVPPTEESRELTRLLLERAIEMLIRYNEENGFFYYFATPQPAVLAAAIEDYCHQRRIATYHNKITVLTELLNLEGVTPELFYGPDRDIPEASAVASGREAPLYDAYGEFEYTKDEFGNIEAQYLLIPQEWQYAHEERQAELEMLQDQFGAFGSFPGLGRLSNPFTRTAEELPDNFDGTGKAVAPPVLGLQDIFCTVSTGKININTAEVPVLYALLPSLPPDQAEKVARDIWYYRTAYQEEMTDEEAAGGPSGSGSVPDYGQPRREPPTDEELMDPSGTLGMTGLEGEGFADAYSYEDYETNYFTNLRQLVLIDGEDRSGQDLLNEEQIARVDESYQSPLQLVTKDLEKVVVFGSTYFTARISMRTEDSPIEKRGSLIIHRDVQNRRVEVVQWKEAER